MVSTWKTCGVHLNSTWCPCGNHIVSVWKPCDVHVETMWFPHGNYVMPTFETIWCPHRNHMVPTWKSCGDHMDTTCIPCGHQDMISYVTSVAIRSRKITNLWMPVTSLIIVRFSICKKFWKALGLGLSWFYQMVMFVFRYFYRREQSCCSHFSQVTWIAHGNVVPAHGCDGENMGHLNKHFSTSNSNWSDITYHVSVSTWNTCGVHMVTTWFSCGYHVVSVWTQCGFQVDTIMVSNVAITWFPCEKDIVSTWTSHGNHMDTMCYSSGHHMASMWIPCGFHVNTI